MRTGVQKTTSKISDHEREGVHRHARDSIADALTFLTSVREQNFYARTINLLDRIAIPNFGTMGVAIHQGKYIFIYDPYFATRIGLNELRATCEHEVLHIILEHIPRSMRLHSIFDENEKELAKLTSNLAVDMAANELLALSWPDIKNPEKPLGFWVTPEGFEPPLPNDLCYEDYHLQLMQLLKDRLESSPKQLYEMAKQILKEKQDMLNQALSEKKKEEEKEEGEDANGDNGENKDKAEGDQKGQGQGQGTESDSGAGEGAGQGQGQGQSNNQGSGGLSEDLQKQIAQLDPLDKKILEMLTKAMTSHLAWENRTGEEGESHKLSEHGKSIIKQSYQSHDKSRGTLPGHIMELIRRMLMPPTVAWTELLHDIVQRTRQTKKIRGMAKPAKKLAALKVFAQNFEEENENDFRFRLYAHTKRMPVFPGVRHSNKFTIVYAVDTSGSMSTNDLQLGLSELQHIQKADSDVRICVVYIDTNVSKEYWVGPNDEIDEEMTGRGGTDFEPAFEFVEDLLRKQDDAPDIFIYCTDGYAPAPKTKLPIPTVWLLTPNGRAIMNEAGHINIHMKNYQFEDPDV